MKSFYRNRLAGFTLIELMITVTIIGIVAAIAYPAYNQYVLRTHRQEGKDFLQKIANKQELYFASNNTYTIDLTQLGYPADPAISEHNYYSVAVDNPSVACPIATCYSLTATAIGSQARDATCPTLTLTSSGRKTAPDPECWEK